MLTNTSDDILWCVDTILRTFKICDFSPRLQLGPLSRNAQSGRKITYFEKSVKSYLHTIRWHPRYLQASSKYKQCILEEFSKIWHFWCLLYPKRPKSKIPKNRKKCIFFKKSNFFKGLSGHHRCSEMVPNSPPKCSKHISNQYLMFTSILDHFLKNRKNSIFEKKFEHASTKLTEFIFSGRISAKYHLVLKKHIKAPFRKKSCTFVWSFPVCTIKNIFIDQFGQNPYFCT